MYTTDNPDSAALMRIGKSETVGEARLEMPRGKKSLEDDIGGRDNRGIGQPQLRRGRGAAPGEDRGD